MSVPAALPAAVLVAPGMPSSSDVEERIAQMEAKFQARLQAQAAEAQAEAASVRAQAEAQAEQAQAEVAKLNAKIAELASAKSQEQQSRSESSHGKVSMRVCHFLLNRALSGFH